MDERHSIEGAALKHPLGAEGPQAPFHVRRVAPHQRGNEVKDLFAKRAKGGCGDSADNWKRAANYCI